MSTIKRTSLVLTILMLIAPGGDGVRAASWPGSARAEIKHRPTQEIT